MTIPVKENLNQILLKEASLLGERAFKNGICRIPKWDKELIVLFEKYKVTNKEKLPYLKKWLDSWDSQNKLTFLKNKRAAQA